MPAFRRTLIAGAVVSASAGALSTGLANAHGVGTAPPASAGTPSIGGPSTSKLQVLSPLPVVTGPITVVLPAIQSSATQSVATPDVPITCQVNLTDYVHYSAPGNDVSWHWKWTCDFDVYVSGSQALYDEGYPIKTAGYSGAGISETENIPYNGCVGATWYGQAYGTFSAPGHLSVSFGGGSPSNMISCP